MADATDDHALILQISADNSKMLRAFETAVSKIDGYSGIIEGRAKKMATGLESAFATPNPGKSLDAMFNATRNQVMAEASSRVGVFGAGLGALGPIGLLAAAGVGAFALSMDQTQKALDFAANVEKLSQTIGVSTDFIQQYNFALRQNDIDVGAGDESLKKFNVTLGLVQSGLARKLQTQAFKDLGFTPEQLRGYHDAGELFPVLADRVKALGNAAEQAAFAKRLGLEEVLPLLKQGAEGFSALAKEASDLGVVMDGSTISKAVEAKRRLTELDDVMQAKSMITFAQFADTLVHIKEAFLGAETAALNFLAAITGTLPKAERLVNLQAHLKSLKETGIANIPGLGDAAVKSTERQIANLTVSMNIDKMLVPKPPGSQDKAKDFSKENAGRHRAGPADQADNFDKTAQDAYEEGLKALIGAQAALLLDIQARANAEKAAVDAGVAKKLTDLSADEAKIRKSKNDAHAAAQIALIETAKTEQQNAAAAQKELIDRKAAEAIRLKALEYSQTVIDGEVAELDQQRSLTYSETQRGKIALQLVDLAYQKAKAELEGLIASKATSDADKKIAQLKLAQLNALQAGKVEDARRTGSAPAQQANSIVQNVVNQQNQAKAAAEMYAEIDRQRQKDVISERVAVQAKLQVDANYTQQRLQNAQQFFGDLATLSQSSNATLHAIGKAAAIAQATIDGILAVQKALAAAPPPWDFALAAAAGAAAAVNIAKIAGLKEGGPVSGPGGPTDDKVLRWLSDGEYVNDAASTAKNRPLLEFMNAGGDVTKLLSAPVLPSSRPLAPASTKGVDIHIHPTWHITNPDPDLSRLIAAQPRVLKRTIQGMIANREIDFGG